MTTNEPSIARCTIPNADNRMVQSADIGSMFDVIILISQLK